MRQSAHVQALVGCSWDYLVVHLVEQFKPGMTLENQGQWHIDHIKPLAAFNPLDPEDQEKAWHYTNLQPLWAHENLSKGGRL